MDITFNRRHETSNNNLFITVKTQAIAFGIFLFILFSGNLFSQVITAGHAGKLESGSAPFLNMAFSAYVSGNFAYVVGNGSNTLEIVDITNPAAPMHKSNYSLPGLPQCVFVSGNFVYVGIYGTGGSIEIIDATDPANPKHKGGIADGSGGALLGNPTFVFVSGNYAYVSSYTSNALEILDVSDPALPVHKATVLDGGGSAPFLANASNVFLSGGYAFVTGLTSNSLEIVDISNPVVPSHKGSIVNGINGAILDAPNSVYVSGNYAYIVNSGTHTGIPSLEIIDISNPALPVHRGNLKDGGGVAPYISGFYTESWSVVVKGNYAYIVSADYNAVEIVDVSNPALPQHFASLKDQPGGANLKTPYSIFVDGNYAYVASYQSSALEIIDITSPANPTHKSSLLEGTQGALLTFPNAVFVSGNYAYVASSGSNALEIVDVTNPNKPVHMGYLADGGGVAPYLNAPTSVFVVGKYAYVTSPGAVEIINVSNPALPTHAGSLLTGPGGTAPLLAGANSIYVSGSYAFVTSQTSGALEIINVSNPASPVHAAFIKNGVGGVPPLLAQPTSVWVSQNLAYVVSKGSKALEIIDVSNPLVPAHKGSIANGTGGALLGNPLSVTVSGNYAFIASNSSHALEIVDVTDPANPRHATHLVDGGGIAPYLANPRSVFISGNYAYVTTGSTVGGTGTGDGLEIVDITTPTSPVHQSFLADQTGGAALNSPSGVYVAGNYAYVASAYSNALEVIYLYSPRITGFSPTTGATGTPVSISGYNFNTLLTATFNGTPATVTGPVTLTNTTVSVPAGATIGKISVAENGGPLQSATNFIVIPATLAATHVLQTSFTANWSDVGAAGYYVDVSTDNFTTFPGGYSNYAVGNVTAITIGGLLPGTTYQYRVRSSDGTSASGNSNAVRVMTIPLTPAARAASPVNPTSFTANWGPSPRSSGYYLDVAYDINFTKYVVGYNSLNVPGVSDTTQSVTGLNPYTSYYYRVRAYDSTGISPSSTSVWVLTPDKDAPVIVPSPANLQTITVGTAPVFNVSINDNVRVDSARLYVKGITQSAFTGLDLQNPDANGNYAVVIQPGWVDPLGLEYYFWAMDEAGNKVSSPITYARATYPSLVLPPLPSGDKQNDYRILAFPFELSTENLSALYLAAPWTDNTKAGIWWWDPTGSGKYSHLGSTSSASSLVAGNGYWVLVRNSVAAQLTNITAPNYNRSNLYPMTLKPKWNEIGNPYPIPISWNQVRAFNPTANISELSVFNGSGYETADILPAFEGGFVKNNGPADITILIPFPGQTSIGGRVASVSSDISTDDWNIFLHIHQGEYANRLGGFGMNPSAASGPDRYDNFNPPAFMDVPEVDFVHSGFPGVTFSKDMVNSQEDYIWQFTPAGSLGKPAQLTWSQGISGSSTKQLFLLDEENVNVIDMTAVSSYDFVLTSASRFRIFYGTHLADKIAAQNVLASAPYPNPIAGDGRTTINLALPDKSNEYSVTLEIFNVQGELMGSVHAVLPPGIHPLACNLAGNTLTTGLYLYKLAIVSELSSSVYTGKIVKP